MDKLLTGRINGELFVADGEYDRIKDMLFEATVTADDVEVIYREIVLPLFEDFKPLTLIQGKK